MGFRFRKVKKLLPGVKINFNKKSVSMSLGPKGMKTTIGSKGTHNTIGLPGSGLSYTTYSSHSRNTVQNGHSERYTEPYSDQRKKQLLREAISSGDMEKAHAFSVFNRLSVEELLYIRNQAESKRKSKTLARILAVFGGPLGLQRFYVGDYAKGGLFFLAAVVLAKSGLFVIPWVYDIFKIGSRVYEYNNKLCVKLAEDYLDSEQYNASLQNDSQFSENAYVESIPKFCVNCGAKLNPGSQFCGNCGARL